MNLLLSILLILSALPLPGAVYSSNPIGQRLSLKDGMEGIGWELDVSEASSILYKDGVEESRTEHKDGLTIEISGGRTERTVFSPEGLVSERMVREGDDETLYSYFYADGDLSSVSISENGTLVKRIEYILTPSGRISSMYSPEQSIVGPDYFIYTLDGNTIRLDYLGNGRVDKTDLDNETSEYRLLDDGSWENTRIRGDEREVLTYDSSGRLIGRDNGKVLVSYSYSEEGALLSEIAESGNERTVTEYSGSGTRTIRYRDDVIVTERMEHPDSIEEIRYRDGKAEYRVIYDLDGKRILEVMRV